MAGGGELMWLDDTRGSLRFAPYGFSIPARLQRIRTSIRSTLVETPPGAAFLDGTPTESDLFGLESRPNTGEVYQGLFNAPPRFRQARSPPKGFEITTFDGDCSILDSPNSATPICGCRLDCASSDPRAPLSVPSRSLCTRLSSQVRFCRQAFPLRRRRMSVFRYSRSFIETSTERETTY